MEGRRHAAAGYPERTAKTPPGRADVETRAPPNVREPVATPAHGLPYDIQAEWPNYDELAILTVLTMLTGLTVKTWLTVLTMDRVD